MKKSWSLILILLIAFVSGWLAHKYGSSDFADAYTSKTQIIRETSSHYQFTNPILFIDNSAVTFPILDPLKSKFEALKQKNVATGNISNVSVYFRDLTTTRWTGIDIDEQYDPASMLKVALLIAYLREAADEPTLLDEKLFYTGNTDKDSFFSTKHDLVKNRYYSVNELITDMIVKSGNDSTAALFTRVDKNRLAQIYDDLGFSYPEVGKPELISAKMYSRLFRVLYSSNYLDRGLSEDVLKLLSETEFNMGLTPGVPQEIKMAHKFGERTATLPNGQVERQLHDCGIVYYPDHPYFLCVMTKGQDFEKLGKVIGEISSITYTYWDDLWNNK